MNVYGVRNWSTIAIDAYRSHTIKSRSIEGKNRGFIQIHVAVNTETGEVFLLMITNDITADKSLAVELIEKAKEHADVKVMIGNGGYDSFDIYEAARKYGIHPIIKLRKDSEKGRHEYGDKLIVARDSEHFNLFRTYAVEVNSYTG